MKTWGPLFYMRKYLLFVCVLYLVGLNSAEAQSSNSICMVTLGVESNICKRMIDYVSLNTASKVEWLNDTNENHYAISYWIDSCSGKSNTSVTLILKMDLKTTNENLRLFQEKGMAILNVACLTDSNKTFDEKQLRRVERESMRLIGLVVGMEDCSFPLCAMNNSDMLDVKARNFCPPCCSKLDKLLRKRGIKSLTE